MHAQRWLTGIVALACALGCEVETADLLVDVPLEVPGAADGPDADRADPDAQISDAQILDAQIPDVAAPDAAPAPPDAAPDPDPAHDDDFAGAALADFWRQLRPEVMDVEVADGALTVTLNQRALWYNESQGPAIYQTVRGDFRISAAVRTRRRDQVSPPDRPVELAGLMARDGESAQENYVFLVVGFDVDDLSVETKSTVDDVSDFIGPPWPSADAELRICRLGADFHLYQRPLGGADWALARTYARPDLPETLQVGLVVYTSVAPADVSGRFEAVDFAPVRGLDDCAAD